MALGLKPKFFDFLSGLGQNPSKVASKERKRRNRTACISLKFELKISSVSQSRNLISSITSFCPDLDQAVFRLCPLRPHFVWIGIRALPPLPWVLSHVDVIDEPVTLASPGEPDNL
jgi:hypothetical protein